jgi:hypothetical protein
MKKLICGVAAATALLGASASAQAQAPLVVGVDTANDAAALQPVQYIYGGHDFCWYDGGWGGRAGWRHGAWVGGPGWHSHPEWGGWRGPHDFHGGYHGGGHDGGHEDHHR